MRLSTGTWGYVFKSFLSSLEKISAKPQVHSGKKSPSKAPEKDDFQKKLGYLRDTALFLIPKSVILRLEGGSIPFENSDREFSLPMIQLHSKPRSLAQ